MERADGSGRGDPVTPMGVGVGRGLGLLTVGSVGSVCVGGGLETGGVGSCGWTQQLPSRFVGRCQKDACKDRWQNAEAEVKLLRRELDHINSSLDEQAKGRLRPMEAELQRMRDQLMWEARLQPWQTEESLHTQVVQGTIRPVGAQAPRLVIVGPARSLIDHLRKKASERSSAMAQPLKPAMHKMHEHGGAPRTASVATPLGNAVGAGQPIVIGPAKATGPAHSQHAAMGKMDQQPLPLPCEVAPSVMSMQGVLSINVDTLLVHLC